MKNMICHVEIPVNDKKKADSFYKSVFSWEINFENLPKYGLASYDQDVSVGFPIRENFQKENLRFYIEVEDINKTLKDIETSGGKTVSERQKVSDEIGFSAKFEDCFGNQLGLFSKV
ncbi:MAG: VOC family protein [Candidatus Hodarchaeales archaeon]|jgi:predicted enzyme related to lactoylglutathione lyase